MACGLVCNALCLIPVSGKYAGLHARRVRREQMDCSTDGSQTDAHSDKLKMKSNVLDLLVAEAEDGSARLQLQLELHKIRYAAQFKLKNELHMGIAGTASPCQLQAGITGS